MDKKVQTVLDNLLTEAQKAVEDPSRTLNDVRNPEMKDLLQKESTAAIKAMSSVSQNAKHNAGLTVGGGIAGAGAGTAIAAGVLASSATGIGVSSFVSGAGTAAAAAATGAAAGSAVPIVGTIAGAAVGVSIGFLISHRNQEKAKKQEFAEREELRKAIEKQNRYIRQLEKELEQLRKDYENASKNEARYKYILSIIMMHYDLRASLFGTT